MAENLGLFRCPLPIFIFFLFHGSVLSVVNGDLWKIHCISLKDHSVCEKKMFLLLVQMVSVCRKTELLEFKNWSFMERSILLKEFDVDEETRNYIRQVHGVIFSKGHPVPLKYKPYLVAFSQEVLTDILDLNDTVLESPAFIDFAAGNEMIPNLIMLSHRYGGHQVKFHRSHCFYLGSYSCKLIKQAVNERIQAQSNKLEIYYFTGASVG